LVNGGEARFDKEVAKMRIQIEDMKFSGRVADGFSNAVDYGEHNFGAKWIKKEGDVNFNGNFKDGRVSTMHFDERLGMVLTVCDNILLRGRAKLG
jgi:hypothetical protein